MNECIINLYDSSSSFLSNFSSIQSSSSSFSSHSSYSTSESSYSSSSYSDLSCSEHCLTCDGIYYNECTSCEPPYTLTSKKTCVYLGEICGNYLTLWYFYYDNDTIKCLSGYSCQNKTSKYIVETLECLPDCENYSFLDKYKCIGCENENFVQIFDTCIDKDDSNEISNTISKYIKNFIDNTISIGNSTYQIGYYQVTEKNNLTSIDLGEWANELKTYYHTDSLIVLIVDTIDNTSITNNVKYNVFSSDGKLLDLSICDSNDITIITPITNTSYINYDLAKILKDNGIDLYDINDDFYQDFCNNQNISDQDLTLEDRINDIYVKVNFCGTCEYSGINYTIQKIICKCSTDNESNINNDIESSNSFNDDKSSFLDKINDNINYKIIKCYKYFLAFKYFKKNLGFYLAFILSLLCFIFMMFFFIDGILI